MKSQNNNLIPLSLCIITLNEESNIKRCINSASSLVDDVVVLDSGSADNTRDIADKLGARVFNEPWRGFGPQKQRAMDLAKNEWVLCLDADEELSPELLNEIKDLFLNSKNRENGYRIPRRSFHLGRWLRFGGWYPDYQTRLFSRSKMQWSEDKLHEFVKGSEAGYLKHDILHYPFESLADQVNTNNKYSTLGLISLEKKGKKIQLWHLLFKPWVKFIELYIFKQGIRDGIPGLIIAIGGAYSYFLKYAKLWEYQNK